jgi:signal transduction histidine kinase
LQIGDSLFFAEHKEAQSMREKMRGKCQNMSRLIENAVVNVGRIITDLRPSILDHQGLWAALEWHAQEWIDGTAQAGDEVNIEIDVLARYLFRMNQLKS